uniref:Translocon at the inner envelope membrane of chloroplasts 214 n=1 Tax=Risleya atropurpurea TaxID=1470428 RepID=A0A7D4WV94_9ASPA|nr:hypothetical protein RF1 [Risleya atropurpurea]
MIFKSFILYNPLSLCMKIINLAIVVGFYYGFLTTFSIGPSYLFLLRARVMEEGIEREVSATTGFIVGQLMMFISIYYAPLHIALGRPHTITVLVLPYLLFHFFWNNHKNFFDYRYTISNSMRNLSIQCVFLNNIIFQLFNHFILPSSALARLVNIYMFRCNNKILFLTSSFVGWFIGHILFMKWVGLVFFWIRQNHYIRYNKYLVSELNNSMARIFSILLFITCVYYLGRMPSPIVTKKLKEKETSETEEIRMNGKEKKKDEFHFQEARYQDSPVYEYSDLEIHQENGELVRLKKEKNTRINKQIKTVFVSFFFDYKRWNRPLRYIKNDQIENALRNEMSQFVFFKCTSDGKQRISFTYPPSLSTFSEMLERRSFLHIIEKLYDEYLYNSWIDTNEKKQCNLNNELRSRIKILEKNERSPSLDMLEKRTILCDDEKCLSKTYDPFFNGPGRGTRKKFDSRAIMNTYTEIDTEYLIEFFLINKIHYLLLNDSVELHHPSFLNYTKEKGIDSESQEKYFQFVFDVIPTSIQDQKTTKRESIGIQIEEISKKISRWSYKLTENWREEEEEDEEELEEEDYDIYSRIAKRVIIYNDNEERILKSIDNTIKKKDDRTEEVEASLIRYSQQSDFSRNLIKGSMRAQRRKTVIIDLLQVNAHSPLFLDRLDVSSFFLSFYINNIKNIFFSNCMSSFENENIKGVKKEQTEISEAWDTFIFTQVIRSLMLVIQSFLRKYIILPSLIIAKNIFRMLLFQIPEWDGDFKECNKELHIKCTYNGVQLSEKEFPQDWLIDGIQIKILYPFYLKPWRKSKTQSHHINLIKKRKTDFCFLTVWGMETKIPFGSIQKQPSFFEPIYKKFQKRKKKIIKTIPILNLTMKKMENPNKKFELQKKKIYELSVINQTMYWLKYLLIERRIKDISYKTIKIRNQIERTAKDKKNKIFIIYKKNLSGSQKHIWKILKRKNSQLIRKLYYFIKLFIEKIYIDILLYIINIFNINAQLLFKSTKKIFNKFIYKNKINKEQKGIDKTNKNQMNFILTIKNLFFNTKNSNQNLNKYWNLSYLPQAYVFYKLAQNQFLNKYKLRSVLKYKGNYLFFFKDILKNYFMIHGICNSKSKQKKFNIYIINEWKTWLNCMIQNKELNKLYLYKKYYRYDILLYKYISFTHLYSTELTFERNKNQEITYYLNKSNPELLVSIPNNYYIEKGYYINKNTNLYRKYFNYKILNLFFFKNIEIWTNVHIGINIQKNTKIKIYNFKNMNKKKLYDIASNYDIFNLETWFFPEFILLFNVYKIKSWIIPIKSLFLHFSFIEKCKKIYINPKNSYNKKKKKKTVEKDYAILEIKKEQYKHNNEIELDLFFQKYFLFQLRWTDTLNKKIMKNIKIYCLLLKLINPKEIIIYSIQRSEINMNEMLIQKNLILTKLIRKGIFLIESIYISIRRDEKYIIYQTMDISLINNKKHQLNKKDTKKIYIEKEYFEKYIVQHGNIFLSRYKNHYDLSVPENILSPRRRREFRIRICFNLQNFNVVNRNKKFYNKNRIINYRQFLNMDKHINTYINNFIKFKLFFWPNYQLEDIACINRYWFNTNNSSRFSMSRIRMYSQFKNNFYIY